MAGSLSTRDQPSWQSFLPTMTKLMKNPSPELRAALAQIPAMAPPPGVKSNLVNPESIAYRQTIATSILMAIMMLFVFNRIYVKAWLVRKLSWDDGMSKSSHCDTYSLIIGLFRDVAGRHHWDHPPLCRLRMGRPNRNHGQPHVGRERVRGPLP